MPLTVAGDHVRHLTGMLKDRPPAAPGSGNRPAVRAAGAPLAGALAETGRDARPTHQLSGEALELDRIRSVVAVGRARQQQIWPPSIHGDPQLTIVLAAFAVTGLRPALYSLDWCSRDPVTDLSGGRWLPELRQRYNHAPAQLHICGDLAAACGPGGPGYGAMLVRACGLGHALWWSAVAAGLAGATYGRTSRRVTETARRSSPGLAHLMTVAIGSAAADGVIECEPQS